MERLGYMGKKRYEEVVKERDALKIRVTELEEKIRAYEGKIRVSEESRRKAEEWVERMKETIGLAEVADIPKETVLAMFKKAMDSLLDTLR